MRVARFIVAKCITQTTLAVCEGFTLIPVTLCAYCKAIPVTASCGEVLSISAVGKIVIMHKMAAFYMNMASPDSTSCPALAALLHVCPTAERLKNKIGRMKLICDSKI
ncbi:hypothetical protein Bbelb_346620 [Branchiostoma belcheri]|nr:hypothetical protein Bbelb_346620 [Branchiostoma belcheri]